MKNFIVLLSLFKYINKAPKICKPVNITNKTIICVFIPIKYTRDY